MKIISFFNKAILFIALICTIVVSCKRTEIPVTPDPTPTNPTGGVVNDAAQVTASVSGIVLDETNAPIANAVVTSGTATTTTNTNGMFIFQNISLSKENGNVTVVKAGYFKGIRSFKTTQGKNHTVRIQLMQKVLSGTVNAAAGGTITSNGGASIVFPANAFVTSTGVAYTGVVSVYSRWIDPTAANLPFVMPGDLRGVSTTGVENILETYGMVGAELTDASGNVLKIAAGKTATISFPIPASLSATAPASIVLWHFDEASARWKENGTATKTGSTYTAQVDKFSFWNCDVGSTNFINLDYTLINATTNTPLVSTSTRIKRANGTYGYGITNNAGFVSGLVPKNEALVLEVTATSGCNTVVYSQNIGPFANNTSLGNILVALGVNQYISFTGTLLNCGGTVVSNGYITFYAIGGYGVFASSDANGAFSFSILNCSGSNFNYNLQGIDNISSTQSPIITGVASSGLVNLGNVLACGLTGGTGVYIVGNIEYKKAVLWKNNVPFILTNGVAFSDALSVFVSGSDVYIAGYDGDTAKLWKNGTSINLSNGLNNAKANSVFVNGSDVYATFNEKDVNNNSLARLWKNGVVTNLPLSNGIFSTASSVFVSGSDVYISGSIYDPINGSKAKLWKNGIVNDFGNLPINASPSSLVISGTDIYAAGSEITGSNGMYSLFGKVWKNGVSTTLLTANPINGSGTVFEGISLSSVFVKGIDVYAAGYQAVAGSTLAQYVAKVWKNGVVTNLTNGTTDGRASSVFVFSTDVYVVGSEGNLAKVWKNGVISSLNSGGFNYSYANSIFVK
jgi:hypothetical protein